jgi:anti-sigma B factor antagonist
MSISSGEAELEPQAEPYDLPKTRPEPRAMSYWHFDMNERREDGRVRLSLLGELDLASVPALDSCLRSLREQNQPVRLDLSQLDFIDSTGIHLLYRVLHDAREEGWQLQVDPELTPGVQRVLTLVKLKDFIVRGTDGS